MIVVEQVCTTTLRDEEIRITLWLFLLFVISALLVILNLGGGYVGMLC